ncbi:unnamed protein product [Adineta ricciae]|uniref:Uncharacterized protein n=1 Tax=Adineta ricciae TaxID=249248 RepID=A0A814T9N5_ADIRI|nr:unnamed protein product [Adineta ricciae]
MSKLKSSKTRGVIVTLMRSTNRSASLTINMIHSVMRFHSVRPNTSYPFLIFHDKNFTSQMKQHILSCTTKYYNQINISFLLINFTTSVRPAKTSQLDKSMSYRLMCRFWTYDVFYHPAVRDGGYEYLMRMDDDSYFADKTKEDLFVYMKRKNLDYGYRTIYFELTEPLHSISPDLLKQSEGEDECIYNNFFLIRLKWYYESKEVQKLIGILLKDDLILREYIGDGCVHAAMLNVDPNVRAEHLFNMSYGHNFHVMERNEKSWLFTSVETFYDEIEKSYLSRRSILTGLCTYIVIWFIISESKSWPKSPTKLDQFLTSSLCGRLIRYPNTILNPDELKQLENEALKYLSYPKDCRFFKRGSTASTEELTYPLAFTIMIYSNLDQFEFLLQTIYRKSNYYCIHVDLKAPIALYQAIQERVACVTNIFLPKQRVNVTWGQFSVLEAEHLCQKELLQQAKSWKYYFNLANSDIPLKTNTELIQILKLYNNQNDVTSLPYRSQLRQKNPFRSSNRTLPPSITLPFYKGEFHVLLTREAVDFIHMNERVKDLYNFLNGTIVPDEHYYSMINRWKETPGYFSQDHDLSQTSFMTRYKIWADRPERALCRGGFTRTICVFNHEDLWHLATSPHLFANKIFFQRDRSVAYCMGQYLDVRDRMRSEEKFSMINEDFYRRLNNVALGKRR